MWARQESSMMDEWLLILAEESCWGPVNQPQSVEFEFPLRSLNMADSVQWLLPWSAKNTANETYVMRNLKERSISGFSSCVCLLALVAVSVPVQAQNDASY